MRNITKSLLIIGGLTCVVLLALTTTFLKPNSSKAHQTPTLETKAPEQSNVTVVVSYHWGE